MKRFKNILYVAESGVDQSACIARVMSLTDNNQADITLLDVVPQDSAGIGLPPGGPISQALQAALMADKQHALDALAAPYRTRREMNLHVAIGHKFIEVIRAVLRDGYDLVIKPAQNPSWLDRLFGSDDIHLLRKCPCPVWLMKADDSDNYRQIVAAVDIDPQAPESITQDLNQLILDLSCSLALSDFAALHVFHAWDAPTEMLLRAWGDDGAALAYVATERNKRQYALDQALAYLRTHVGAPAYDYLVPQAHLQQGEAAQLLAQFVTTTQADLLVMGTLARTGIAGFFIGNTAELVLSQLNCSVLALKPPGFISPVQN